MNTGEGCLDCADMIDQISDIKYPIFNIKYPIPISNIPVYAVKLLTRAKQSRPKRR